MTQECMDLKIELKTPGSTNKTLENTAEEFEEHQKHDGAFFNGSLGANENNYLVSATREGDESRLLKEGDEKNGSARKRHRRGSRKNKPRKPRQRYKPFNKLTWDEKRQLDERDTVKALRRREELVLQKGRPIAPYNTTQFLMEEHDPGEANFQNQNMTSNPTDLSEDSSSSSSSDEYFVKDFDEFYERVHIDTLNSYSKEDLIKYVFELEARIEKFERETKNSDCLKEENYKLLQEIKDLRGEKAKN